MIQNIDNYNTWNSIRYTSYNTDIVIDDQNTIQENDHLLGVSYLYWSSLEATKMLIKKELGDYFSFETPDNELFFLEKNFDLVKLLPTIANYIKSNFDPNSHLVLELLDEGDEWQTLFINVYSTFQDWENINKFTSQFLDNLYSLFSHIANKINLNILSDEL